MHARYIMIGLVFMLAVPGLVQAQYSRGDLNCDGMINSLDIDPFVLALTSTPPAYPEYYAAYPGCDVTLADTDCDGSINSLDIDLFVQCLTGGCPPCPTEMVLIPASEFMMGNCMNDPNEGWPDELPVHAVYVDAFYMDVYEVTNEQYCAYLNSAYGQGLIEVTSGVVYKAGDSKPYCDTNSADTNSCTVWNGSTFTVESGRADHPMVEVSWYGAAAYSNWRSAQSGRTPCYDLDTWECNFSANGYRLPTEAEWEKAARGGTSWHRFPWSDTNNIQHARANYYSYWEYGVPFYPYDTSATEGFHPCWGAGDTPYTSPVGFFTGALQYKADWGWPGAPVSYQTTNSVNGYGLYDMVGNVPEWCNDWYSSTYYSSSPYDNPTGPTGGMVRIMRGGGWSSYAFSCRAAYRNCVIPGYRNSYGFRCAAETP